MNRAFSVTLAAAACLLAAPAVPAQGLIVESRPLALTRLAPAGRPRPAQPLSVREQKVSMQVTSGVIRVDVEQVFYNPNNAPTEGTYLFPLPHGAAVSSFRMLIDREPVEGKMLGVEDARRLYESYVRRDVDPAILEYVGQNAFQARVSPIPPGGERRLYLTYSQPAQFSNGVYRLAYPLNSERVTRQTAGDLTLECVIRSAQPLKAIYSPTHEVQVKRESDNQARAVYSGKEVRANRDFVLYYTTSERAFGLNALAHRRPGEDGYVMMMLAPRREASSQEILPKDVVLVLDTSGSMQGAKIEQARKAGQQIISALNEQDRFNIVRFSSDTASFRPGVVPATKENRDAARAFVSEFKAIGGTAIDDALQAGLASFPGADAVGEGPRRASYLIFMTDGLPTIGVTEVDRILANVGRAAPKELRMFCFGVGADVNTLLLDRMARDNRGAADYVTQDEELETTISSFYAKISDPVLSNVRVAVRGAELKEIHPNRLPDLFAGTQLLILGRYQGAGRVTVSLQGEVNGRPESHSYELVLPERELGQDFIPRLWAGRRIGFLLEEIRLRGEEGEVKDEVVRLSKEHGIVTPYTAYLVEDPAAAPAAAGTAERRRSVGRQSALSGGSLGGFGAGGAGGAAGGAAAPPGLSGPAAGAYGGQKPAPAADSVGRFALQEQLMARKQAIQQADGYYRSTGANAVEASRRLRQLSALEIGNSEVEVSRSVAGRVFRRVDGVWTDESIPARAIVVNVKFGSDAYFKVIGRRAEWARFLSVGRSVAFRSGKGTAVRVGEQGKEKLSDQELKALER